MKLAVSITTMNRPDTLLTTLRAAVALSAPDVETAVTVIDNGSVDEVMLAHLDDLERAGVRVIRNATNLGLSRAVNQGLAAGYEAGAGVLVHLDDDALIRTQDWDRVFASYFAHPRVGLVVTNPAGVGIPRGGHGSAYATEAFASFEDVNATMPTPGPEYREVSWGLGFCWALRREVYEAIGGYDPQIMHQNEVDLALRVRMAGYDVAGINTVDVLHNDPGGPRSDLSLAREHLGCVQFRDKWTSYHRGARWNYGTSPLYLHQHWPVDQDFLRRYAEYHGVDLNPPPGILPALGPGVTLGITPATVTTVEDGQQMVTIDGARLLVYRELRNDYAFWERGDGYLRDREQAIARWADLTGEVYRGYDWGEHLKPRDA